MNSFKFSEGGKLAVECASNYIISQKCSFHVNCEVLLQKISEIFRKIGKKIKCIFWKKNVFFLLKGMCN